MELSLEVLSVGALLRADLEEAAAAVLIAQSHDAENARTFAQAVSRRDVRARTDHDAMGDARTETISQHLIARRNRNERGPQRGDARVASCDTSGAIRRLDWLLEHQAFAQCTRRRHSDSTR